MLRWLAWSSYRPALAFYSDSYEYLQAAAELRPPLVRPLAYPLLLRGVSLVGSVDVVPALQHLLGLGLGAAVYALLLHRGCRRWIAALAAAPVLLDAYQINIEQFVLSETLFSVLLLGLLALALYWVRPPLWACAAMGALAAAATLTRTLALPITVLVATVLLARRVGVLRIATYLVAAAVPLLAYASWFSAVHGTFGLERIGNRMLYGKVAPFADCGRLQLSGEARLLCDPPPPTGRSPNYYTWDRRSPAARLSKARKTTPAAHTTYGTFARSVIRTQPLDYAAVVTRDLVPYVLPGRVQRQGDARLLTWQFFTEPQPGYTSSVTPVGFDQSPAQPRLEVASASVLRTYQRWGYAPGPLLALCWLTALAAALWPGGDRRLRLDCLLLAGVGGVLALLPALTVAFDYRFLLPQLVVLPLAAALATRRCSGRRSQAPVWRWRKLDPPRHAAAGHPSRRPPVHGAQPTGTEPVVRTLDSDGTRQAAGDR